MTHSASDATLSHLSSLAEQLIVAGRWISARHWVPATGGNFSARLTQDTCLVTASGRDKGQLTADDLLHLQWQGSTLTSQGRPSAETLLHTQIYDLDSAAQVAFHTHSVQSTVFSRLIETPSYRFHGYEMQKAIEGNNSHTSELILPIVDNSQDMTALAHTLALRWQQEGPMPYAFLVRGHGMYAWGKDMQSAKRHLEGWEFLIECELKRIQLTSLMTDTQRAGNTL